MEMKLILSPLPSKLPFTFGNSSHRTTNLRQLSLLCATVSPDSNSGGSSSSSSDGKGKKESNGQTPNPATKQQQQQQPSPTALNIRYRARSRRQAKKEQQGLQKGPTPTKKWEDMTLSEKALELYVGEKGILFWLNKFAYASIYAVIGGWILFRFVGPYLGLYQLNSPPLSPTSIFNDSTS